MVRLTVWYLAMASAPLYSDGPHEDTGSIVFVPILLVVAAIGGLVLPRQAGIVGAMTVLPALSVSLLRERMETRCT